jgi:16S rRNA (guanine527-N7)-methyltransferase
VTDRADTPPVVAEDPPPNAAEVFGPALPLAQRYVGLLATTGVERGLIGPREAARLWERHMLNSAALALLIPAEAEVVDVGSGAGLPGIPIALTRPDLLMTLLEPMARRVTFLTEVVGELGLHVEVQRGRAEDLPPAAFDVVVARAVAPLARLVPLTLPALRPGGRLLALKGASAAAEITAARLALRSWPGARVTLTEVPAGADTATVVVIDLDADAPNSGGSQQ